MENRKRIVTIGRQYGSGGSEVGKKLAKENVIIAADMTTEAVVMKLMWALAHFGKNAVTDIKKYIETPVFCDRSY